MKFVRRVPTRGFSGEKIDETNDRGLYLKHFETKTKWKIGILVFSLNYTTRNEKIYSIIFINFFRRKNSLRQLCNDLSKKILCILSYNILDLQIINFLIYQYFLFEIFPSLFLGTKAEQAPRACNADKLGFVSNT